MSRKQDWTPEEFALLVASAEIDADQLSRTVLADRTADAIATVRQGIRRFANGEDSHGILSRMMVEFLEKRPALARWAAQQSS
jgi:hypothetical protein